MFYLKCRDIEQRTAFLTHMSKNSVLAVFHYIPLHSAPAGKQFGRLHGADRYTTQESERLARLPIWFDMKSETQQAVIQAVREFFA